MPLDGSRWELQLLAADKTASAFKSVETRIKSLDTQSKSAGAAMSAGFAGVTRMLGPLASALSAAAVAQKVWSAGMKAANMGEQAEQIGLTTDQLQAYRLAAAQAGIEAEQMDAAMMRLSRSMGSANDGNDEAITRFEKLGVKVLDANGNLRKAADVMPEVARGLLGISSETERSATMQELFGRSGARMVTVLEQLAQGNDRVVQKAKDHGAVISGEVIAAWDKLDDQLKVTNAQAQTAMATLGAPIATWALDTVNKILTDINANLAKLKLEGQTVASRAAGVDVKHLEEQLAAQKNLLSINPNNKMAQSSVAALERRISAAREEQALQESADAVGILAGDTPAWTKPTSAPGARNPVSNSARKAGEKAGADAIRESQRQMDELFASFEKIRKASEGVLDKYGTGAETAARKTEELNEMLQLGYIDVDTFGRAMKDVTAAADDQARAVRGAEGGFDGFLAGMEQSFVEMDRMNSAFQLGQDMSKLLANSFTELATTGELNFNKLLASFANMISQMLIQAAAASALQALFGAFGGGGAGGAGIGNSLGGLIGGLLAFADGGHPPVGRPYVVGEDGPEVRVDGSPGTIFNREQLAGMGGGGTTINIRQTVIAGEFATKRDLAIVADQTKRAAIDGAQAALINRRKRGGLQDVF